MRLQYELAFLERAPAAGEPFPVLKEVDGPLELIGPARIHDFSVRVINQNEGTGLDERIHRPVLQPNESVAIILDVQTIEQSQWELTPALNHAA